MSLDKGSKGSKVQRIKVGLKIEGGVISIQMPFKAILLDELEQKRRGF